MTKTTLLILTALTALPRRPPNQIQKAQELIAKNPDHAAYYNGLARLTRGGRAKLPTSRITPKLMRP